MLDISRFFQVIFQDPAISHEEFRLFSEDHLAKLTAQNAAGDQAGQFTAMIAATAPLFTTYDRLLSQRDSAGAGTEGDTVAKDAALAKFKAAVSQREGLVRSALGKGSAGYQEFFPHGAVEYSHATMGNAKTLMDRMVNKATKYVAQVGAPMVTEFTGLRADFTSARGTQLEQKGNVADAIRERDDARAALAFQVMGNVLDIAKMFRGQPERCNDFFDQSKLKNPKHTPPPPPAPPAPPSPTPTP